MTYDDAMRSYHYPVPGPRAGTAMDVLEEMLTDLQYYATAGALAHMPGEEAEEEALSILNNLLRVPGAWLVDRGVLRFERDPASYWSGL